MKLYLIFKTADTKEKDVRKNTRDLCLKMNIVNLAPALHFKQPSYTSNEQYCSDF